MSILFVDFEASGLGPNSWPIEIGFAWLVEGQVHSDARLIRPDATWELTAWNTESALVHGIGLSELASAEPAEEIARWAAMMARDMQLISDAPAFDQIWLNQLLELDPGLPRPRIEDFDEAVATHFDIDGFYRVYSEFDIRRTDGCHRAGLDAIKLAQAWRAGAIGSKRSGQRLG